LVATFFFAGDFFVAMVSYPSLVVIVPSALCDITSIFCNKVSILYGDCRSSSKGFGENKYIDLAIVISRGDC